MTKQWYEKKKEIKKKQTNKQTITNKQTKDICFVFFMHKQTLTVHCATTICFDWFISFSSQHKEEFAHRVAFFFISSSCFLCMVESITYCFVFYVLFLLRLVSCVSKVVSFSVLSIRDFPFGFSNVYSVWNRTEKNE